MARNREMDFSENVELLREFIAEMSVPEMSAVYTLLKDRHNRIQHESAMSFEIDQLVEFDSKHGGVIRGRIDKINRKTIGVSPEAGKSGLGWRVSPSMLRLV